MFSSKSTPKKKPADAAGMGGDKASVDIDSFLKTALEPEGMTAPKSSMKATTVKTVPEAPPPPNRLSPDAAS